MAATFKVTIKRVPRWLESGQALGPATVQGLNACRPTVLQAIQSQPNQPASIQSKWATKVELRGQDAVLVASNVHPGARYLDQGRKPGKQPPPAVMAAWAARVLGDPRLGYVVGRKIGEEGIAARYWVRGAMEATRGEVKRILAREIVKGLQAA